MQKLIALNSPFVIGRARALAAGILIDSDDDPTRVKQIYERLFARQPDRAEMRVALDFLRRPETPGMTRWEQYAQMLLALNEMLYVD
jgi:hypothetical protein